MNTILVAWVLAMFVCSIYTFILPAWDSLAQRRRQRVSRPATDGEMHRTAHPAH